MKYRLLVFANHLSNLWKNLDRDTLTWNISTGLADQIISSELAGWDSASVRNYQMVRLNWRWMPFKRHWILWDYDTCLARNGPSLSRKIPVPCPLYLRGGEENFYLIRLYPHIFPPNGTDRPWQSLIRSDSNISFATDIGLAVGWTSPKLARIAWCRGLY